MKIAQLPFFASRVILLSPMAQVLAAAIICVILMISHTLYIVSHDKSLCAEKEGEPPSASRMIARLLVGAICILTHFYSTGINLMGELDFISIIAYASLTEVVLYCCLCFEKLFHANKAILSSREIFSFIKEVLSLICQIFYTYGKAVLLLIKHFFSLIKIIFSLKAAGQILVQFFRYVILISRIYLGLTSMDENLEIIRRHDVAEYNRLIMRRRTRTSTSVIMDGSLRQAALQACLTEPKGAPAA